MTEKTAHATTVEGETLLDAGTVVFNRRWSARLPILGSVSVELRILSTEDPNRFRFSITAHILGRTFNWSRDVSDNTTIRLQLVAGFALELDIAGWAVSAHQLSFDLLVKITGPFGISATLFHRRVNIPLTTKEEVETFASLDSSELEQFALVQREQTALSQGELGRSDTPSLERIAFPSPLVESDDPRRLSNARIRFTAWSDGKLSTTQMSATIWSRANSRTIVRQDAFGRGVPIEPGTTSRWFDLNQFIDSNTTWSEVEAGIFLLLTWETYQGRDDNAHLRLTLELDFWDGATQTLTFRQLGYTRWDDDENTDEVYFLLPGPVVEGGLVQELTGAPS